MSCVHMQIDFTAQQVSKYQSCSTSMTSRQAPRKHLMLTTGGQLYQHFREKQEDN